MRRRRGSWSTFPSKRYPANVALGPSRIRETGAIAVDHDPGVLEPAHQVAVGGVLSGYTEPPGPLGGCVGGELAREGLPQAERPSI